MRQETMPCRRERLQACDAERARVTTALRQRLASSGTYRFEA